MRAVICQKTNLETCVRKHGLKPHGFAVIDLTSNKNNGKYRSGFDTFYIQSNYKYICFNKLEALPEKIVQNTEPKSSLQIIVSNNKTRFKTRFGPPIQLDKTKQYDIALIIPSQISKHLIIILGTHPITAILGLKCIYQKEDINDTIQQR